MNIEARKLNIIERVMRLRKETTLTRYEELLSQIEMDDRAQESLSAIGQGEVYTMDEFKKEARAWMRDRKSTG
ncbi:MAG: hypothetical protein ABEH43_10835 [Flavobacteriales bacterium]